MTGRLLCWLGWTLAIAAMLCLYGIVLARLFDIMAWAVRRFGFAGSCIAIALLVAGVFSAVIVWHTR